MDGPSERMTGRYPIPGDGENRISRGDLSPLA
ncbi:hypothetical protein BOSEA31B_14347 [Hyphomicrobiales bacterium]|nr:hypothetical protein BOSEA31B_14347 [Hyphomicrobiales bacterium]CAI0343888.1 hypothetical protein BO1005MUT1_300084 [Hyphomicrobiales bacterium]